MSNNQTKNSKTMRRRPPAELAEGEDRRWAEDVLPLVAKMMRLRGYTELRVELQPQGFRYEMLAEALASGKEGA